MICFVLFGAHPFVQTLHIELNSNVVSLLNIFCEKVNIYCHRRIQYSLRLINQYDT